MSGGLAVLEDRFQSFDSENYGLISKLDFRKVTKQMHLPLKEVELNALMAKFTHDTTGKSINYRDFMRSIKYKARYTASKVDRYVSLYLNIFWASHVMTAFQILLFMLQLSYIYYLSQSRQ